MTMSFPRRLGAGLLGLALAAPSLAAAQPNPYNLKYRTGQTVQPIFEGWSRKADGGFTMHFGYFNRNFVEEVHVPVGPDNHFDPAWSTPGSPRSSTRVHTGGCSASTCRATSATGGWSGT